MGSTSLQLTQIREISEETKRIVGSILGQQYDNLHFQGIRHGQKIGELGIASRFGGQYSENNMGFGEGRTLYIVDLLENSPEQSLFVIEEPETSLHEHAQHELAKYLLEVCSRRHHQIIITTHSDRILGAVPAEARIMVHRDNDGVEVYKGLSSTRARSLLSLGRERDLIVFVEDNFAKLLLTEMIRAHEADLLNAVNIEPVGSAKEVRNAVLLMDRIRRNSMAVRDADQGDDPASTLFSFPGTEPPEKEIFRNQRVQQSLREKYEIDTENILHTQNIDDHHQFAAVLSKHANTIEEVLSDTAVQAYLSDIGQDEFRDLYEQIKARA